MNLNVASFKVKDISTGSIQQSGRTTTDQQDIYQSFYQLKIKLKEKDTIEGTPNSLPSNFNSISKLTTNYIEILRDLGTRSGTHDKVFIPDMIRVKISAGTCDDKNMILYAFSNNINASSNSLRWFVLFANTNSETRCNYVDIPLPDMTLYPSLYMSFVLINGGFSKAILVDSFLKIFQMPSSSSPSSYSYYCINPAKSNSDIGIKHMITSNGYTSYNGYMTRVNICFEDLPIGNSGNSDRDYNDVVLSVSSVFFDENYINDNPINPNSPITPPIP
jgi:hypothetical protein